jgi:hypothetical protein
MHNKIDVIKIKEHRQRVLLSLQLFYESYVQLNTLYRTLCDDPTYSKSLFRRDITYFDQKGYLEFIDDKIGGMDDFMYKVCRLSEKGKEIAEGTRTDEALDI